MRRSGAGKMENVGGADSPNFPRVTYDSDMPLARDSCICLRKTEYSETSQILSLFGRTHGVLRVIAKGAHRRTKAGASKFDGGIDLLDIGDAVFTHASEKQLGTLCEWSLRDGQRALRQNLRAVYLGQYAAELISALFEAHDPHPRLFAELQILLEQLPTERREEIFLWFELELLREAGFLPELTVCAVCRRGLGGRGYFSSQRGGALCESCAAIHPERHAIDLRLLRLADSVLRLPRPESAPPPRLPRLSRHQTDPLNRLLAGHIEEVLGKRLRLPAYVLDGITPALARS